MTREVMLKALEEAKRNLENYKSTSETTMFEKWYTKFLKEVHSFSDKDVEDFLRKGHNGNYIKAATLHRFEGWLAGRGLK